jgi:response regulator RpfG family c-di-GMP phosphodiesterase
MENIILYVDDEPKSLKYFKMFFEKEWSIMTAETPAQAWEIINTQKYNIAILLADQRMPIQTGVELLEQVKLAYPKIIRILTTAYTDSQATIDAVNGVPVSKPCFMTLVYCAHNQPP